MFDCPEANHTSPTSKSERVSSVLPWTVRVKGPPAGSGLSHTSQRPRLFAVVAMDWPWKVTAIFSAGEASPHRWMGASRCRTAWSVMTLASRNSACKGVLTRQIARVKNPSFIAIAPERKAGSRNKS